MTVRVFVPRDTAAVSVGAEQVAAAIAAEGARRGADLEIVRTGSRGLFWLEPLVRWGKRFHRRKDLRLSPLFVSMRPLF